MYNENLMLSLGNWMGIHLLGHKVRTQGTYPVSPWLDYHYEQTEFLLNVSNG